MKSFSFIFFTLLFQQFKYGLNISEIDLSECKGWYSPGENYYLGELLLSDLVYNLLSDIYLCVDKKNIILKTNPCLKIRYFSQDTSSIKEKATIILDEVTSKYELVVDVSRVRKSFLVITKSYHDKSIILEEKDRGISTETDGIRFKNKKLHEIVMYLRKNYKINITMSDLPFMGIEYINSKLTFESIKSEKDLISWFKKNGFETEINEIEVEEVVSVTN